VPTTSEDEIRALLRRQQVGQAFELAMSVYGDRMLGLAVSILGDRSAAEDAVQDVMIRIWRALPQFRGDAAISTWIYSITRNRCLTILKQRRGEPVSLDAPESREAAEQVATTPLPNADVWSLLHALPLQYRQVLTLFYAEERSYEEIARALDMPMGTVKTHIHRGRKLLASLYAEGRTR
jgi:RNA polymerase sigma-70 factor (ECF subfamily)